MVQTLEFFAICPGAVFLTLDGAVGVTVVSTRVFHLCDPGSIPAQCSYQIKIPPWSHVRRVFPV